MSEISLSAQQQLTQALAQLTRAQNSSPLAKQVAQVIIQHLAGNQISLSVPRQQQSIELPKPTKLPAGLLGTPLDVQLQTPSNQSGNNSTSAALAFFDPKSTASSTTLLANLSQGQIGKLLDALANKVEPQVTSKPQIVNAKVIAITNNTLTVSTQINQRPQTIQLSLNTSSKPNIDVGQQVQLQIVPQGNNWKVTLLTPASAPKQITTVSAPQAPQANTVSTKEPAATSNQPTQRSLERTHLVNNSIQLTVSKSAITTLLQSESARPAITNNGNQISLPRQDLQALLVKQPGLLPESLTQKIVALPVQVKMVTLSMSKPASGQLTVIQKTPAMEVKLTPEQTQSVKKLIQSTANEVRPGLPETQKQATVASPPLTTKVAAQQTSSPVLAAAQNNLPVSPNKAPANLETPNQTSSLTAEKIAAIPVAEKQQVTQQISEIIRRIMPQTVSPSQAIIQLEKTLADPAILKNPETSKVIEQLAKQIQQSVPQGKDTDAAQIKQVLVQSPLVMTSTQIAPTSQNQNQGLIGGLITLLQVTLAARMAKTQPQHSEGLAQAVSTLVSGAAKPTTQQSTRSMNDLSQLDQKHQLLKQVSNILAQHQLSKLASAEQNIQGQDSFYYVLPSGSGEQKRDIELLIKRETESQQQNNQQETKSAVWHLTMKLDIGDMGQILTKAKLRDTSLELDLYTSNQSVKEQVLNFLPLFKKRLESLGIEVAKSQCQLGKIPTQLQQRPYQIFETQA